MKTVFALRQDLKKVIFHYGFIMSTIITIGLCFTSSINIDYSTGNKITILELLLKYNKEWIIENVHLSAYDIYYNSTNSYIKMFIPIIAAFPFVPAFCSERNCGNIRFVVARTGRFRYYLSKFVTCMIGGGFAVSFGYALFGIIFIPIYPSVFNFPDNILVCITNTEICKNIIYNVFGMFLYGAVSTIPALLFTSIIKNRYLILCTPFMLIYLYQSIINRLIINALAKTDFENIPRLENLSPDAIQSVFINSEDAIFIILFNMIYITVAFAIYILLLGRRLDKGD